MNVPRWLRAVASTLVAVLFAGALLLFAGVMLLPRVTGAELRTVTTGSMSPALRPGTLVVVFPVAPSRIRPGDVVMFRQPDQPERIVTHRVLTVANGVIVTKGDANGAPDPWRVRSADVIGKVAVAIPRVGPVVEAARSPVGFALLVVVPAVVVLMNEASVWWRFLRGRPSPRGGPASAAEDRTRPRPAVSPPLPAPGRVSHPSLVVVALALVAFTASTVSVAAYLAVARGPSAGVGRLADEALSLSGHSAYVATSEAYARDIAILRLAEDPALRSDDPAGRAASLRRLLEQPSNMFDSLAVIGPDGRVLATTDPAIVDVHASAAFLVALAQRTVASSALPPQDGAPPMADYAVPLANADGSVAGVLLARTSAARLWPLTLATTIDGSRNLIVDADGNVIAGGPAGAAGRPWRAQPDARGTVRTELDGAAAICGVGVIGEGTPLDVGWRVASCLPASLAAASGDMSLRRYILTTATAAGVAVVIAAVVLYVVARAGRAHTPRRAAPVGFKAIEARLRAARGRSAL